MELGAPLVRREGAFGGFEAEGAWEIFGIEPEQKCVRAGGEIDGEFGGVFLRVAVEPEGGVGGRREFQGRGAGFGDFEPRGGVEGGDAVAGVIVWRQRVVDGGSG